LWDRADVLWTLVFALYYTGRLVEAETLLPELEATARRAGHLGALWAHERAVHSMALMRNGDVRAFLGHTEQSMRDHLRIGVFLAMQQLAACYGHLGDFERAAAALAAVEEPAETSSRGTREAIAFGIAALRGDAAEASARCADTEARLPVLGQPNVNGAWQALEIVVPGLMLIGRRDRCAELYPVTLELIAMGLVCDNLSVGPTNPQLAAGISAWAGDRIDTAREHFDIAARQSRDVPIRLLQPTVGYWYGRMLREIGDAADQARGGAMLESAAADFRALEMIAHADLADRAR
jgi:tetratricopeptide (TPR) repeat protein